MPDLVLQIWKLVLLGFLYLFFLRVLRAVWASLRATTSPPKPIAPPQTAARHQASARSSADAKTPTRLQITEPPEQKGRSYDLDDEITIGRAPGCKINVDDTFVSQLHARVFRRDGQILIEDLGSTNGTLANGKKVSGPVPVKRGDRIQVGRTVMEAVR